MGTSYAKYSGLSSSGGVSSLNSETGAVTIVAGAGIVVTPAGQNITITNSESTSPTTIGPLDAQAENANGLALVANVLTSQSADATHPGMVNNTTQSFSGNKTFTGTIAASNLSGTNTGDVTLAAFGSTPNANGLSLSAQALNLQPADATHSGGLSSTDWNTFNNKQSTLTLGNLTDAGTDGIVVTGGTGAVVGSGTSLAQHVADTTHNGYLSSTDWNTFNSKQAGPLTGDVTTSGAAATLATVNGNVGSFGSSTAIPSFTVNGKGLITAASTNVVIAPAGTLTGTTLASNVVTSSLTTVGTIGTGVWNGTAVTVPFGGTGDASFTAYSVICGGTTSTAALQNVSGVGSSGQVLTSNGASALPTWQASSSGSAVALVVNGTPANVTTGNPIIFPTVINDTDSGYNATTGKYTVPSTGYYLVCATWEAGSGTGVRINIYLNGSSNISIGTQDTSSNFAGSGVVNAPSGQTIDIRPASNITSFSATASTNALSIVKIK